MLPMTHKERFEALGIQPPKGMSKHWIVHVEYCQNVPVLGLQQKCYKMQIWAYSQEITKLCFFYRTDC